MSKTDDARKEAKRKAVVARLRDMEGSRMDMLTGMLSEETLDALILAFGLGRVELSE